MDFRVQFDDIHGNLREGLDLVFFSSLKGNNLENFRCGNRMRNSATSLKDIVIQLNDTIICFRLIGLFESSVFGANNSKRLYTVK